MTRVDATDRRTGAVGARPIDAPDHRPRQWVPLDQYVHHPRSLLGVPDDVEYAQCDGCGRRAFTIPIDAQPDQLGVIEGNVALRWCIHCLTRDMGEGACRG